MQSGEQEKEKGENMRGGGKGKDGEQRWEDRKGGKAEGRERERQRRTTDRPDERLRTRCEGQPAEPGRQRGADGTGV